MPSVRIVLATNNPGKLKEMQSLFAELPVELISQADLKLPSVPETGTTFVENALLKARHVSAASGHAAIADDSGLVVPALGGAPGIYSARYASDQVNGEPTDTDNNDKLISQLRAADAFEQPAPAFFYCAMVFLLKPEDPTPVIASAAWHGHIIETPRGNNGFGYDPHFLVPHTNCTSAELAAETKNQQSHRALASRQLLTALGAQLTRN